MALAGKKRKVFDSRYEILSIVGRGAASVVYHARHVDTPTNEVALKVLLNDKEQRSAGERLRKEALAMVSSRHRYVIRLDDFHSVGDLCYLSMEYAPESDLRKYCAKTNGVLHPLQAELFLLQLAEALAFIHKAGIVHRDIKPDNMLVVSPKEIRLGDFGVAVLPGEQSSLDELRRGVGTMDYMAPEVLEGKVYSAASDLYSLGVSFYELLSGKHPFASLPLAEQLDRRAENRVIPLDQVAPQVPSYLSTVIMQAMRADPAARYSSAKDLAQAILVNKANAKTALVTSAGSNTAPRQPAPNNSSTTQATDNLEARRATARALLGKPAAKPTAPSAQPPPTKPAAQTPSAAQTSVSAVKPSIGTPSNAAAMVAAWASLGLTKPNPAGAAQSKNIPISDSASSSSLPTQMPVSAVAESPAAASPLPANIITSTNSTQQTAPVVNNPIHTKVSADVPAETESSERVAQRDESIYQKSTQVITKDLVSRLRADLANEPTPASEPVTDEPASAAVASAPGRSLASAALAGADNATNQEQPAPTKPPRTKSKQKGKAVAAPAATTNKITAAINTALSHIKGDEKRKRYLATTSLVCLFLFLGNLFLVRTYNVGIAKSYLGGTEDIIESPLPRYTGEQLSFPNLPSGVYKGSVKNLGGIGSVPFSIISIAEHKKIIILLGLDGWKPAVVAADETITADDGSTELRLASSGMVFQMRGQAQGNIVQGTLIEVPTGNRGDWSVSPVTP